jgi:glutathione S-transferase
MAGARPLGVVLGFPQREPSHGDPPEHASSGRFCHGESPTVADICLVTQVTPAMTFNLSLDPCPRVVRVYNTCMAIPAFADAHPSKQPDAE